jgi:hypothetical protein
LDFAPLTRLYIRYFHKRAMRNAQLGKNLPSGRKYTLDVELDLVPDLWINAYPLDVV